MRNGPSGLFLSSALLEHHHILSDVQSLVDVLLQSLHKISPAFTFEGGNGKKYHLPFLTLLCFQAGKFNLKINCGQFAGQKENMRVMQGSCGSRKIHQGRNGNARLKAAVHYCFIWPHAGGKKKKEKEGKKKGQSFCPNTTTVLGRPALGFGAVSYSVH